MAAQLWPYLQESLNRERKSQIKGWFVSQFVWLGAAVQ